MSLYKKLKELAKKDRNFYGNEDTIPSDDVYERINGKFKVKKEIKDNFKKESKTINHISSKHIAVDTFMDEYMKFIENEKKKLAIAEAAKKNEST